MDSLQRVSQSKLESWQRVLVKLGLSADEYRQWNNVRDQLIRIAVKTGTELTNPNAGLYYYNVYAQGINNGSIKYEYDRLQVLAVHRDSLQAVKLQFKSSAFKQFNSPMDRKKSRQPNTVFVCNKVGHLHWQCPDKERFQSTAEGITSKSTRTVKKKDRREQ